MENSEQTLFDLNLDHQAVSNIQDGAKWAKFVSILLICILSLAVLCILLFIPFIDEAFGRIRSLSPLVLVREWIYPILGVAALFVILSIACYVQLLRFSINAGDGITAQDQAKLEKGITYLKRYLMLLTVIDIIGLAVNLASFLFIGINN